MKKTQDTPSDAPRRDPLLGVVDARMLRLAWELLEHGQDERDWQQNPVPRAPVGQVRAEALQAFLTFALPAGVLGASLAATPMGWHQLAVGPIALALGNWNHKRYLRKRAAARREDLARDNHRFAAVMEMSQSLGLRPDEITLERVRKMRDDYLSNKAAIDFSLMTGAERRRLQAFEAGRQAQALQRRKFMGRGRQANADRTVAGEQFEGGRFIPAAAGVTASTAAAAALFAQDQGSVYPGVNPHTGMRDPSVPMVNVDGTMMVPGQDVDIHGNPFGVTSDDSFMRQSSSSSFDSSFGSGGFSSGGFGNGFD